MPDVKTDRREDGRSESPERVEGPGPKEVRDAPRDDRGSWRGDGVVGDHHTD